MQNNIEKEVAGLLKYLKQEKLPVEIELLALHEATSALWAAYREKMVSDKIREKLANVYLLLLVVANKLKIKGCDTLLLKRIGQIRTNKKWRSRHAVAARNK